MRPIVIGTRGSKLALVQSHWVAERLVRLNPGTPVSVEIIRTTGDKMKTASLVRLAGDTKGLFVKEIEEALLKGRVDLAVHSLKDLPTELPEGLSLGAVPEREDPRDAFVASHKIGSIEKLPAGARVGTSSLRREIQLRDQRPDVEIVPIRGNVDTRIRKMHEENLDGIVLAAAGLNRLGRGREIDFLFPVEKMIPAIGQGALAIEMRTDDNRVARMIGSLNHAMTHYAVLAERKFLTEMGGGCQVPMGAHVELIAGQSQCLFQAFVASPASGKMLRGRAEGPLESLLEMATEAAVKFKKQGGDRFLREVGL